ncbi:hypothetical protein CAPTEDRAFT_187143 [Capitella teleta]|uniref:Uncharacterized protein n=1 Tax=Capitella teleta TaxID=283909 RepID=R7V641_CAPTE|nr:hypothetical protein CAPTEDRAFT_187143 [Capitella teleta]|eukprot:ELU14333.1 hypothetical protein CAPTEDRAFT_187143 [Capitella teleta]
MPCHLQKGLLRLAGPLGGTLFQSAVSADWIRVFTMESNEKLRCSSALLEIEKKEVLQRAMNFLPEIATANSRLPNGGAASIEETEDSEGRFIEMNLSLVPRDESSTDSDSSDGEEENDSNCDSVIEPVTEKNIKLRKGSSGSRKVGIEDITESVGK